MPIRFVSNIADAGYFFVPHKIGNFFDHSCLVHLIRYLCDDYTFTVVSITLFNACGAAHHNKTTSGMVGRSYSAPSMDLSAGWKIGAGYNADQFVNARVRVLNQQAERRDNFTQIMRRDVCCHADSDTPGTVYQEPRQFARKDRRFLFGFVVVGDKIDRIPVEIFEHLTSHF